jgi:diguanylate cyclase (GGDEF)-like protein
MIKFYSKTTSRIVLALLAGLSFIVFVFPGIKNPAFDFAGSFLLWLAVFAFLFFYIRGRYRVEMPRFMEKPEHHVELDYILPRSLKEHYHEFLKHNLDLLTLQDGVENVYYYLFNRDLKKFILQESILREGVELASEIESFGNPIGDIFEAGESLLITNEEATSHSFEKLYRSGRIPNSLMGTPIIYEEQVLGVLAADSYLFDGFQQDDIKQLIEANARLLSSGLQYLEAIYQLDRKSEFLHKLANFNTLLSMVDNENDLFEQVAALTTDYFHYDKLLIAVLDKESEQKGHIVYTNTNADGIAKGAEFSLDTGIWSHIINSREPLLINKGAAAYPVRNRFFPDDLKKLPYQSLLGAPLVVGENILGAITLESRAKQGYVERDRDLLSLISYNFASAYYRLKLYQTMKMIATIDGLTSLYNHRAFKERVQEEMLRADRYKYTLVYMMMDLDKFKRINDTYGHVYGDYVLRTVADILKNSVRAIDIVGRYGGEEFSIVLANARLEGAFKTAERIRKKIADHPFEFNQIPEKMAISIGLSAYPQNGQNLEEIIISADEAMYEAKKLGGNKLITAWKKEAEANTEN